MFCLLNYRFTSDAPPLRVQVSESAGAIAPEAQVLHLQPGVQQLVRFEWPGGGQLIFLGDPVFRNPDFRSSKWTDMDGNLNAQTLYWEVRGHYYWFFIRGKQLACGTSFGAIFPLYYHADSNGIRISSSAHALAAQTNPGAPDRRYLLERLLFNYPFFNTTPWTNIRLLGTHRQLTLSENNYREEKTYRIESAFGSGKKHTLENLAELTELFEDESRLFLPDAPFAVSFTGGFDGRTLVALARKAGRPDFFTYSFGMPGESDISFPAAQAKRLGIPYMPILLDSTYVQRHAMESARAFLRLSEYNGNLGRPHYHYAAKLLAEKTGYIMTGNFGSELFRAMHQPGVMMSEALIHLFAARDASWKDVLRQCAGRQATAFFRTELDALIADLEQYLERTATLDANQRFYRFVVEEIFRKYFGPELVMQSHFLRNRTPYLSLRFFRALNDTVWSGVHARLFEKQKKKRMKGQVFYAALLRRTDWQLYHLPTNKGYSPADVLEAWRLPLLLARVAQHKFLGKEQGDSNAVESYFKQFSGEIARQIQPQDHPVLFQSGIAQFLEKGKRAAPVTLEKSIHYYTIAAAWAAAERLSKPAPTTSKI